MKANIKSKALKFHLHPRFRCSVDPVTDKWHVTLDPPKPDEPSDWFCGAGSFTGVGTTFEKALEVAAHSWREPA